MSLMVPSEPIRAEGRFIAERAPAHVRGGRSAGPARGRREIATQSLGCCGCGGARARLALQIATASRTWCATRLRRGVSLPQSRARRGSRVAGPIAREVAARYPSLRQTGELGIANASHSLYLTRPQVSLGVSMQPAQIRSACL
jgi:hypothetical protein